MFTLDDVKGIELDRLIAYIMERNKEQKIHRQGQISSAVFDLAGSLYSATSQGQMDSFKTFNHQRNNQNYSENDSASEKTHSIDMIKETEDEADQDQQNNEDVLQKNEDNSIMVTKPQSPKSNVQSRKNVKFSSQTKTKTNSDRGAHLNKFRPISNAPINMKFIMLSLKNNTIDHLKQQFIYNDNDITLQRFLYLMKQCISYDKRRDYQISYQLIKLFEQIDIDCNKSIDWEEFLEYLACYGWTSGDSQIQAGFGVLGDAVGGGDKGKKVSLVVETWNQVNKHRKNTLAKIVEIDKLDMLCLIESKNFTLTFINTQGEKYMISNQGENPSVTENDEEQKELAKSMNRPSSPSNSQNQKTLAHQSSTQELVNSQFTLNHIDARKVLAIDYSEHQKLFGVLQTDRKVHFIEQGEIQKSWGKVQGAGNQIDIMYLPLHKKWVLKRINQYLDIFSSPKDKLNKERIVFKPHQTQAITAIKQLKQPFSLVTAGIDGKIKIWSLASRQLLIELKPIGEEQMMSVSPIKTKGVKGIDTLNSGIQSYFCSWTFTTQIMLWLPSTSVSKPYIGKLHGHSGIVQSCEFVKPQHCSKQLVVSIDNKKVIKIWSVEKLLCLQSIMHEGQGCRIKCLNSRCGFIVYDKVIEFNRLKLSSLMMGNEKANSNYRGSEYDVVKELESPQGTMYNIQDGIKGATSKQHRSSNGKAQQSSNEGLKFVQIQFCTHNILILLLMRTQLKIINIQTGRVQAIFEPAFKDEEQFVHMSLKINRRAFIISTLGYVYYVKLDDASLIKRFEIGLSVKENHVGNFRRGDEYGCGEMGDGKALKNHKGKSPKNEKYHRIMSKKQSLFDDNYKEPDPFTPRFVYYHSVSKILLIVVELEDEDSSLLVTYNQTTGYEFQKMKQIEFPQTDLRNLFFFTNSDVILISSLNMLTIWDFAKLNIVNKINLTDTRSRAQQQQVDFYAQDHTIDQPYVKHIAINQTNSNNLLLIMILTKYDDFIIYELNPLDYSIRQCITLEIPHKLNSMIKSFYFMCTNNQDIQSLANAKFNAKNSKKIIKNVREKQVKFNFSAEDQDSDPILIQTQSKKDDQNTTSNHSSLKQSTRHGATNLQSSLVKGKISQNNLTTNKNFSNKQTKIIYFATKEGSIFGYYFNDLILLLKKDLGRTDTGDGKRLIQRNFIMVGSFSMNITQNIDKRYAAHKIRQTRKASIKQLSTKLHTIGPVELEEHLFIQKQLISHSWTLTFSELYPDLLYAISQKNDLIFFKPTGESLGEWNLKSILPKKWNVTYQLLPKMIERLNKLQEIITFYKQSPQFSTLKLSTYNDIQTQINSSTMEKVLFLANRFLQESDLMELREYVKLSTVKLLNMSKKNFLYKKNYQSQEKAKSIVSLKKFEDQHENFSLNKKKSVTISKHIIQHNIDDDQKRSPSLSKLAPNQNFSQQNNQKNSAFPLSSFGAKRSKQSQMNNNYFQRKFQEKVGQENKLKVHRKYIDKQIEKTLKQAKHLQLKSEAQNNKTITQNQGTQKSINMRQAINDRKQHARNLIKETPNHVGHETVGSNKVFAPQMNNLILEQERQRKQIEKNINFVKRIEESIKKVEMGFTMGSGFNFAQTLVHESKKAITSNHDNKKGAKEHNNNKKSDDSGNQQRQQSSSTNLLKAEQSANIRKRKVSISSNISPESNGLINQSQKNLKSINKIKDPSIGTINDVVSKYTEEKETEISYQVMPVVMAAIKKTVEFSANNKVIVFESQDNQNRLVGDGKDEGNDFQRSRKFDRTMKQGNASNKSLLKKSSKRSFSALGRPSAHHTPLHATQEQRTNSPSRSQLRSASNNNQQQGYDKALKKSRSLYGSQFSKQKQMAMTNYKQGMRDFDNFYKRFGSGWGTDNAKRHKKNRIKLD